MKTVQTSSIRQQGSTLIEILVSMFILALGLMALIAMQTRTSIGIKEAENQTIIAQATENLAENMMTNPKLNLTGVETKRSYSHYNKTGSKCSAVKPANLPTSSATGVKGDALVKYHQDLFFFQACDIVGEEGEIELDITGETLTVKWTMGGSSGKAFEYKYELDNMD